MADGLDVERQDRADRNAARERWLSQPWYKRQLLKWSALYDVFGRFVSVAVVVVPIALWQIVMLSLPYPELAQREGQLRGWAESYGGEIILGLETPEGPLRVVSRLKGYDVAKLLDGARYPDHVVAYGLPDNAKFRFLGLVLNGRVVIDPAQATIASKRQDQKEALIWIGALVAVAAALEFSWRWQIWNASGRTARSFLAAALSLRRRHSRSRRM